MKNNAERIKFVPGQLLCAKKKKRHSETMEPSHVDGYVKSAYPPVVSIHRLATVKNTKAEKRSGRPQAARGNRSRHVPRIGPRQLWARTELFPRDEEIVFKASRRCGRRSAEVVRPLAAGVGHRVDSHLSFELNLLPVFTTHLARFRKKGIFFGQTISLWAENLSENDYCRSL